MTSGRRHQDHFGRRAKREGHPARSIYKLEEIDARWRVFRVGQRVLDLGCAPGSWLQYIAQKISPSGYALGVDLKALSISLPTHVEARVGDVYDLRENLGAFDVIVSDMAPSTMGNHTTDALRSASLVEHTLDLADKFLKKGGTVIAKNLEGGETPKILKRMRQDYSKVELLRPEATRRTSTEIFLIGLGKINDNSLQVPRER